MIIIICGDPGVGKTACEVHFLAEKIVKDSFEDYICAKKEILTLKKNGFINLDLPPQKHLCYADFAMRINRRISAYYVDGFKIGLPNPFFETMFFPPYSTIFLDEAQRYYDSRMSRYLREEVYHWYQLHRHNHYNIFLVCQRLGNIDINIRSLAERIIVVEKLVLKPDKYGRIKKYIWHCREFSSPDTAEIYCLAKEKNENSKLGREVVFKTDLSIFNYYDSYANKPAFFEGQYHRGFDYFTENGYAFSLDGFVEYNNTHYFVAPKGFWKNADYDKKVLGRLGNDC